MSKATILIIEDDRDILRANRTALELEGYSVLTAETLSEAEAALKIGNPDLIILDVMLPDGDGIEWCLALRGARSVRVLFLSALDTKEDTLRGLRAGGDDYITKPYLMDELLVRVEVLLRRPAAGGSLRRGPLRIGGLEINPASRRALQNGEDLLLTAKEFTVLEALALRQGDYIPAEELFEALWGLDSVADTRTVKEHVYRLRRKLGDASVRIESARGEGYRLTAAPSGEGGEKLT